MTYGLMVFEMDDIVSAINAAHTAQQMLDQNPAAQAIWCVSGFDDDDRELDEIPEAREILKAFGKALGWRYFPRFEPMLVGMVLICMDEGFAARVGKEEIKITDEGMDRIEKELEYWKERLKYVH